MKYQEEFNSENNMKNKRNVQVYWIKLKTVLKQWGKLKRERDWKLIIHRLQKSNQKQISKLKDETI